MAVHYTTSEVHDLVCDTSYDESQFQTDESSSCDSESDYDLSDPEAESQQDDLQDYGMTSPDDQSDEDEESEFRSDDDNPDTDSDSSSKRIGSTRGTCSRRDRGRGRGGPNTVAILRIK